MIKEIDNLRALWEIDRHPIASYPENRICRCCGDKISIYNPNKNCWRCQRRLDQEYLDKMVENMEKRNNHR